MGAHLWYNLIYRETMLIDLIASVSLFRLAWVAPMPLAFSLATTPVLQILNWNDASSEYNGFKSFRRTEKSYGH